VVDGTFAGDTLPNFSDLFIGYEARIQAIFDRIVAASSVNFEPHRVCRRLQVWMPRLMQAVFEHFRHVIGCGHVSGLSRDTRCSRWPSWRYAEQAQINLTSFSLLEPRCIS
jgi:hypothetical protein